MLRSHLRVFIPALATAVMSILFLIAGDPTWLIAAANLTYLIGIGLPSIAVLATRKGDAGRGKALLAASFKGETQCLKCHTVRGTGGSIGPDLSMIGKKASRENLIESILYPSKAVADQFINWQIETKKGLSLGGLIVEETPAAVTATNLRRHPPAPPHRPPLKPRPTPTN